MSAHIETDFLHAIDTNGIVFATPRQNLPHQLLFELITLISLLHLAAAVGTFIAPSDEELCQIVCWRSGHSTFARFIDRVSSEKPAQPSSARHATILIDQAQHTALALQQNGPYRAVR